MLESTQAFKLGLAGMTLGVLCTVVCVILILFRQEVSRQWTLAICVLFALSFVAALSGQITVVSKFSSGGVDEADEP